MQKEKVLFIKMYNLDDIYNRIPNEADKLETVRDKKGNLITLWNDKFLYPYKTKSQIIVTVATDRRYFSFKIPKGYKWNGADIPRFLWSLVGINKDSQEVKIASMIHDFILEFKQYMFTNILEDKLTINDYLKLTSEIFEETCITYGISPFKANIMANCISLYQKTLNRKDWNILSKQVKSETAHAGEACRHV